MSRVAMVEDMYSYLCTIGLKDDDLYFDDLMMGLCDVVRNGCKETVFEWLTRNNPQKDCYDRVVMGVVQHFRECGIKERPSDVLRTAVEIGRKALEGGVE